MYVFHRPIKRNQDFRDEWNERSFLLDGSGERQLCGFDPSAWHAVWHVAWHVVWQHGCTKRFAFEGPNITGVLLAPSAPCNSRR